MAVTIQIKRGTEAQILSGTLTVGEICLATDTGSVWSFNGVSNILVGRAVVDTYSNIANYTGSIGRIFYASDTGTPYIHNGTKIGRAHV